MHSILRFLMVSFAVLAGVTIGYSAELQLKPEGRVQSGLVLLGDIAEVTSRDPQEAKRLAELDLFPAPPAGEKRTLRLREIQDLLTLRGINLAQHRFSGAGKVTVCGAEDAAPAPVAKPVIGGSKKRANDAVRQAIQSYLRAQGVDADGWTITFELGEQPSQSIAAAGFHVSITGGQSPWTGLQQFMLSAGTAGNVGSVPLPAQIEAAPSVVVAATNVPRGTVIRALDVRLQAGTPVSGSVHVFRTLDEVIGKETTRIITAGQILDEQMLRRPLLVERGKVVTVYARAAGIQVRTIARCREDGGKGDVIPIESLSDRSTYFARVSGPGEVEIYAQGAVVASEEKSRSEVKLPPPGGLLPKSPRSSRGPVSQLTRGAH